MITDETNEFIERDESVDHIAPDQYVPSEITKLLIDYQRLLEAKRLVVRSRRLKQTRLMLIGLIDSRNSADANSKKLVPEISRLSPYIHELLLGGSWWSLYDRPTVNRNAPVRTSKSDAFENKLLYGELLGQLISTAGVFGSLEKPILSSLSGIYLAFLEQVVRDSYSSIFVWRAYRVARRAELSIPNWVLTRFDEWAKSFAFLPALEARLWEDPSANVDRSNTDLADQVAQALEFKGVRKGNNPAVQKAIEIYEGLEIYMKARDLGAVDELTDAVINQLLEKNTHLGANRTIRTRWTLVWQILRRHHDANVPNE